MTKKIAGYLVLLAFLCLIAGVFSQEEQPTCSWSDPECYQDPNMVPMEVDFGDGNNVTFMAYVTPDVSTFYQQPPGTKQPRKPSFNGLFGKFINLSNKKVQVYWDAGPRRDPTYIADVDMFGAAGTATFPGHRFLVYPSNNKKNLLTTWTIVADTSLYIYDPYDSGEQSLDALSQHERDRYYLQKNNLIFGEQYEKVTGREWLSLYPLRKRPVHPLWPADYFGQEHTVTTRETHFVEMPPDSQLKSINHNLPYKRHLSDYRMAGEELNLTMTVLSCAPRVFEIKNFLSETEVHHIMEMATGMKMDQSTTKAGSTGNARVDDSTRTSRNTWVRRERSPIIDSIYRRSADLMKIDESYLRMRKTDEMSHLMSRGANAEQLQLVHYSVGQQYTPHHDFAVPAPIDGQPMRYSTILFYLNEGMTGGETSFPRWLNAQQAEQLKVVPEAGKAVLFYNLLPDGNMDERSQHAALPVTQGEKWLINLWTWDPMMRGFF